MKNKINWKKTFFVILLLSILFVSVVMVEDKPKAQTNSDCTGYKMGNINYCSEGAYQEYMQTVKITAPLIENYRQLSELGINN